MSGEILIQVIDIVRFQTIRPALSELEAVRMLGSEARIVLREATASPFARGIRYGHFAGLLSRILSHLELELRVFLTSRDVDEVIHGLVRVLCQRMLSMQQNCFAMVWKIVPDFASSFIETRMMPRGDNIVE